MSNCCLERPLVEICAPSVERAREAFALGADRVEICRDIDCGGLTPAPEDFTAIPFLSGPVHVLIRPRPGDFVYSEEEVRAMLVSIDKAAVSRAAGVVVGALTPDGRIDMDISGALVARAREHGLSVTFHRAVDETGDYFRACEDVCRLGVDRILTSGGMPTAFDGRFRLAQLIRPEAGVAERPIILPGKGITADNVLEILAVTGAREIHGTRLEILKNL